MTDPLSPFDHGPEPEESALLGLVDARGDAPWRVVGGISLTARLVRSLELLGVHQIVIAVDREPEPETLGSRYPATRLRIERLAPGAPLSSATSPREVIAVDATLVVDRRLLAALVQTPKPSVVRPAPGSPQRVRLARLDRLRQAARGGVGPRAPRSRRDPHIQ